MVDQTNHRTFNFDGRGRHTDGNGPTEKWGNRECWSQADRIDINRDVKVTAPDFATPSNDFATLDELKIKLAATHQGLMGIEKNADLEVKGFSHPVFGQMSLKQWIPFVGYHERRHILQIKEVREQLGI